MPSFPTHLNDTDALIDFAKDTGIAVGVGFLVPAIVLSAVLIFVFVKFCGGSGKSRQEYTNRTRFLLIILAAIVFLISAATCAVAWAYNNQIHSGVINGSNTLSGVILSTNDLFADVNRTVKDIKENLVDEINSQTDPIINNMTNILIPLVGIQASVKDAEDAVESLTLLTEQLVSNISAARVNLAHLKDYEAMGIIDDTPEPNEIPDVNEDYIVSLNKSASDLDDVAQNIKNMTDDVNATISDVSVSLKTNLINLTDDYDEKANEVLSYVVDLQDQILSVNKTYNDVSDDVRHYSNIRKAVSAAILVLPLVLTAISLAGVAFKIKIILKISAIFCFIFMFWYFLIAGINFIAFYTLDQVCKNQDEIISNAMAISDNTINIPSANVSVVVSQKITELLKCSGDNTLIDIFEFTFLIDDLTGEIENEVNGILEQAQQLNQTDNYNEGLDSLARMENNSVNLDFFQNSSIPTVNIQLTNLTQEFTELVNGSSYFASLEAVNNITTDLLLNNGTTISEYYDETNITTLNCTVDPYDKLDAATQDELCIKAAIAINSTITRNAAIANADGVFSNLTSMQEKLNGFQESEPLIYQYQNDTKNASSQIRIFLDDAFYRANSLIGEIGAAGQAILALINSGADDLVSDTQCAFIGRAYSSLSKNVCSDVGDSLEVMAAMMIVGALMLFFSAIISMVTSYKLERDFIKRLVS